MTNKKDGKICAIIVSHNRPTLLGETIESVLLQSAACDILIVDNASNAATRQVIEAAQAAAPNINTLFLNKNFGGAGGFHEGLKRAWRLGYDGFWLMDDDTIAGEDALGKLLAAQDALFSLTGQDPAFVCSNVRWLDGTACKINVPVLAASWLDHALTGAPYLPVRYASFVSLLISRKTVQEYGLPLKEYFIWFDDSEYTYRISQKNNGVIALDSLVTHKTGENITADIAYATKDNLWKHEFGSRNKSSFIYKNFGFRKYIRNLKKTIIDSFKSRLTWHQKWRIIRATAAGIIFSPTVKHVADESD